MSLAAVRIRTPDRRTRGVVAISTTLSRVPNLNVRQILFSWRCNFVVTLVPVVSFSPPFHDFEGRDENTQVFFLSVKSSCLMSFSCQPLDVSKRGQAEVQTKRF
jgi:hypothetical protein